MRSRSGCVIVCGVSAVSSWRAMNASTSACDCAASSGDADHIVAVQHASGGRFLHRIRQLVQLGFDDAGQARRVHVALTQAQHLGGQREHLAILRDEAQVGQREQVAAGRRASQAGTAGDFADGQAGALLVEGFDHGQTFFQAGNQIALQRAGSHFSFRGGDNSLEGR